LLALGTIHVQSWLAALQMVPDGQPALHCTGGAIGLPSPPTQTSYPHWLTNVKVRVPFELGGGGGGGGGGVDELEPLIEQAAAGSLLHFV
jgi:hypothetical protein